MTAMIAEVYDALKSAGAEDTKARAAAEAVADFQTRFEIISKYIAEMRGELKLVKWMLAIVVAVEVLPYLKTLFTS